MKSEETKKKSTIWEYAESIIIALVLALVDNCHDIVYSENCHDIVDSQL